MRIGLFMTYGMSLSKWDEAGLLSRELLLYRELAKQGVSVSVFSYGGQRDCKYADDIEWLKIVPMDGYRGKARWGALRAVLSALKVIVWLREIRECDVLKTNQTWGGLHAGIASVIANRPLIARSGFDFAYFNKRLGRGREYILLSKWYTAILYRVSERVHVASKGDRERAYREYGARPHTVYVYPNWIDTVKFRPADISEGRGSCNKDILYVGRLAEQKNLKQLIEALSGSNLGLTVVGSGECREDLVAKAESEGVSMRILGNVSNERIAEIYRSHEIFVLPSTYEGNPKSLLEAMSCAMAVIGNNVIGIREVISHGVNGMLFKDTAELRNWIEVLNRDTCMRKRLGRSARSYILRECSLKAISELEYSAYRELVERKGKRHE